MLTDHSKFRQVQVLACYVVIVPHDGRFIQQVGDQIEAGNQIG